jgi:hypothetical protein
MPGDLEDFSKDLQKNADFSIIQSLLLTKMSIANFASTDLVIRLSNILNVQI